MNTHILLTLAPVAWVALYAIACLVWPFGSCWRCGGDGKIRSPKGRHWRRCKRCKGTGARLRIGRRIVNRYSDTARRGLR